MGTCNYCGGALPFPTWKSGELVNCPNCLMETVLNMPDSGQPYPVDQWRLTLRKVEWGYTEEGGPALTGEVMNQSKSNLDWARIDFTLLNDKDEPLATTMDLVVGLSAGALWRFCAPVLDEAAVRTSAPVFWSEFGRMDLNGIANAFSAARPASSAVPGRGRPVSNTLGSSQPDRSEPSWSFTRRHSPR
jgi:hypothetical protein